MKIAILGSRGIPARYGGFETLAEELSERLVKKGHEVTVYCCKPYDESHQKVYKGVKRVVLPTIKGKVLEKPVFALISLLHVAFRKIDVVLMLGVSVACFCFIPRIFGIRVAINIDGLEWQRRKWGGMVARYLKYSEKMAGVTANAVITDARWIQDYYLREYGKEAVYIAYGADIMYCPPNETLETYQLEKNGYILYVGRFDPENNALVVREAYDEMREARKKLVMVGDAPYAGDYIRRLKDTQNPGIKFTGYLFGQGYREIQSNAYLYIQAGEVGGTHLALLEAMGAGNCILANDVPEHREVLGDAGIYYKGKEDLKEKMEMLLSNDALVNEKREAARTIVRTEYSWERITAEYERLFRRMLDQAYDSTRSQSMYGQ